jgi:predicted nucleic acid-binding protein
MAGDEAAAVLDTSFIVRYLTNDPPEMAAMAAQVIDGEQALAIPTVVLAEVWYVLRDRYRIPRETVLDALVELLGRTNLRVVNLPRDLVLAALELCRPSGGVSIADALIWAEARASAAGTVYTFDRRFPQLDVDVRPR